MGDDNLGKSYLKEDYSMPQRWVRSEFYSECKPLRMNVVRGCLVSQEV